RPQRRHARVGRGAHAGRDPAHGEARALVRAGERAGALAGQLLTPSITHTIPIVGTMRVRRRPAASYSCRNSASERWRPPVQTIMLTSFRAAPWLSSEASI